MEDRLIAGGASPYRIWCFSARGFIYSAATAGVTRTADTLYEGVHAKGSR